MKLSRADACDIASQWWSVMTWNDPGVCMYAFGSTGKVQSEKHRAQLLAYIDTDSMACAEVNDDPEGDKAQLRQLRAYIEGAPVERIARRA